MLNDFNSFHSLDDVRLLYFKYKDTPIFSLTVASVILVLSVALLFRIILPQVDQWISLQSEIKSTKARIGILQQNTDLINSINKQQLDERFSTATTALPYVKDYTSIITTIDRVAVLSGIVLDDYSFQVGNLSTTSAKLAPETAISVKLTLKGSLAQLQAFINTLAKITPLSEVVDVRYANSGAGVGVTFFYKYLPSDLKIPYTDPLRSVDNDTVKLLQMLDEWSNVKNFVPEKPSTSSGDLIQ